MCICVDCEAVMTYTEIISLIQNGENRQLELKKTTGELKDAMHTACAFLNTEGGWLIFGITPNSLKITGQQVTDNTQREIAQALSGLEPQVDVHVEYIDIPDNTDNSIIAIHFDGFMWGKAPYTYHGCPYYKVESITKEMSREMFDERLRASKPDLFAWERQVSNIPQLNKLDEKLIRGVVRLGVECGRLPETALTEPIGTILNKWKIINEGKVLNAATALFTTNTGLYTQFTMRLARFSGTDKNEFIDNQRVEGNIFVLLNEAMNFFRKHLNMNGKIVGWLREEHLDIPAEALRETILNALCHRQYERYNLSISVGIYDDRIEIANPGKLPPELTPETILLPHDSHPYNPLIANVLYSTSYIENWGSGIRRIMETCQKYGVPVPEWKQTDGFVVVTYRRASIQNCTKDCTKEITDRQNLIIDLLSLSATITIPEIARKTSISERTIKNEIKVLQELGIICRKGGRKTGHWEIIK